MPQLPHLLLVDDEREIREPLAAYLTKNGMRVTKANSAAAARQFLSVHAIDLILLDIMMPDEDGLSLAGFVRATSQVPVILLTAKVEDTDRIVGLELGADDYVAKPFNPRELLARIKAVLRRTQAGSRDLHATDRALLLSVQRADGNWVDGRLKTPPPDPFLPLRLGGATISLFLIVLGVSLLIARRLVRPLSELARSAEQYRGRNLPEPVLSRGPADLRRAIEAYNAMNKRVAELLAEKDMMLGAIGHDLRTPLASLRIRVENVEPEEERERQVAMIDQIGAMLEDILFLARTGHAQEKARTMDLAALADTVVEEYRERGHPVTMKLSDAAVAAIQPNLVRRALRNLIDNALAYGRVARVTVSRSTDGVTISVADDGPGLPDNQLGVVLDPFVRIERSRNRSTGGSGLGLAIARSVAEGLGGRVQLSNHGGGGLVASIIIPGIDCRADTF